MLDYEQLKAWGAAKTNMDHFKKLEARLRREICEGMFGERTGKFHISETIEAEVGDETINILVKATSVTTLSADEPVLTEMEEDGILTPDDLACFERKLKIKESLLRGLPSESKVWDAITEKPGMPKLEAKQV